VFNVGVETENHAVRTLCGPDSTDSAAFNNF